MNILFIGNSYTYFYDLPELFAALCRQNGHDVRVDSVTAGGRELHECLDESHEKLHPTDGLAVRIAALLGEVKYDVLILQEQSCLPYHNTDLFCAGAKGLATIAGADRTVMYATWGRMDGSEDLAYFGWTRESMTKGLYDAYCKAAELIHGEVSPVGLCFAKAVATAPEINLYDPDKSHPSYAGSCVAALCHYKTVFGEMPRDLSTLKLDGAVAEKLTAIVDNIADE
ncbi:MAG: hypothetical protein IJW90_02000 [Clostridia bacterium]|nr:hypothetical protein [Clostridia bacterium]MBQ7315864.1 hypothetical protein [Clostridia bacterium]